MYQPQFHEPLWDDGSGLFSTIEGLDGGGCSLVCERLRLKERRKNEPMAQACEDDQNVDRALEDYKAQILPVNKARLRLERDLYFIGMTQRGYEVEFDVRYEEGCSPTETLLLSIAGCLSIDVVHILRKMRCDIASYEISAEGTRKPDPPQYYTSFDLTIRIAGKGITPKKIERAIALSKEKYCSVYHSLRPDIPVNVQYMIGPEEAA